MMFHRLMEADGDIVAETILVTPGTRLNSELQAVLGGSLSAQDAEIRR